MSRHAARMYQVDGITCSHCVASIEEEVSAVEGVGRVDVDLESGRIIVRGPGFTDDAVRAAVSAAGYGVRS